MKNLLFLLAAGSLSLHPSVPSQSLADLFAGRAQAAVANSVVPVAGHPDRMHYISTWQVGPQVYAYHIVNTARGPATGLAISDNGGASFWFAKIVVDVGNTPNDNKMRSFPGVWREGSQWFMVMEAAGTNNPGCIMLATSSDGWNWVVDPTPILERRSGWEKNNVGTPSLYKQGTTWHLFYHGFGSVSGGPDDCQVGVAIGTDLRHLTRFANNPVLRTGTSAIDSGTIGKRSQIVQENGYYYMIYEVSTEQPYDTAHWSSAIARSRNLTGPWEKSIWNPVLPITARGFGNDGPELVRANDGKWSIFFRTDGNWTKRAQLVWGAPAQGWTFQAEALLHQCGRADTSGWSASTARDNAGFMVYGPYTTAIPGGYRKATYWLMVDNTTANNDIVVTLDVYDATARKILGTRRLRRSEFASPWQYQAFELWFDAPGVGHLEFRTYWHDTSYVCEDRVTVR